MPRCLYLYSIIRTNYRIKYQFSNKLTDLQRNVKLEVFRMLMDAYGCLWMLMVVFILKS